MKTTTMIAPVLVLTAVTGIFLTGGPKAEGEMVAPIATAEVIDVQSETRGLQTTLALAEGFVDFGPSELERSFRSDIEFYETVLSYGQNTDPRNTFLLVNGYLTSNQHAHGLAFFERLISRYGETMDDEVLSSYLAAYAILRATYADNVPLISRIGWMTETFDLLEEARGLTNNESPIVHWAGGLIYAQVPFFFFKKDEAYEDLLWLAERPETEPTNGFYREAYHYLAKLYASDGEDDLAAQFLEKSGYSTYEPSVLFMGWFTTQAMPGTAMSATIELDEVVPGKVFSLYGFGFSDIHFVVSDDNQELIAIDAGTRPSSLQLAHEFLMAYRPDLPPVTTAILTHAHWDHIGGLQYLQTLNPNLTTYGRENYHGTIDRVLRNHSYTQFRGADFDHEWVEHYEPMVSVDQRQTVEVGGTLFDLIPATGGETEDALLVYIPDERTIFVGDILMPYYGEPWVEEGFVEEAVDTMDAILVLAPEHIIHGHRPLTVLYGPDQLQTFRDAYVWLLDAVQNHIRNGYSAKNIVRLNLIPPGLENHPETYLSYLAPRDHLIARIADDMVGIWQEDVTGLEPAGLDTLTSVEYGRLLDTYLDLSSGEVQTALRRMIEGGDNELAFNLAIAAEARYPTTSGINQLKLEAGDRLRSAAQFFDPFKFVTYSEITGVEHLPIPTEPLPAIE